MKTHIPKKTEYKGIVFDSKSEAVFALALEQAGNKFVYHPQEHCGHVWDFLVYPSTTQYLFRQATVGGKVYYDLRTQRVPRDPVLVEYKPSEPTMTYVNGLTESMSQSPFESLVIWGNPWAGLVSESPWYSDSIYQAFPVFSGECKYGWGQYNPLASHGENRPFSEISVLDVFGIENRHAIEASRFRFDLQWRPR